MRAVDFMTLDTQQVEILGRNYLTSLFVAEDIEIAEPLRDKGIDLIAFRDSGNGGDFRALPIQIKVFSGKGFCIHKKYEKFSNMLMAYVWNVQNPSERDAVIMTYGEAMEVAGKLGWTEKPSWLAKGFFQTNGPGKRILNELEKYRYKFGDLCTYVDKMTEKATISK